MGVYPHRTLAQFACRAQQTYVKQGFPRSSEGRGLLIDNANIRLSIRLISNIERCQLSRLLLDLIPAKVAAKRNNEWLSVVWCVTMGLGGRMSAGATCGCWLHRSSALSMAMAGSRLPWSLLSLQRLDATAEEELVPIHDVQSYM